MRAGISSLSNSNFVIFGIFYVVLRIYELYGQSRESFDANIDEESNHFQELPEEIYEDSDEIKGQLISEKLVDVLNFLRFFLLFFLEI